MTPTTGDDQDDRPAAWLQRDDGWWWAVDEYGIAWQVAAFDYVAPDSDVQAALGTIGHPIDVAPLSVVDTEADW
ncbi:hypothetical protein [Nocardia sp. CNY236]|uniref:hypothetical protein n=1 Tax=Nocardia sp. CNY236 TaxID=1169152 RepID=UPI000403B607|nr:hypothetical protein [Nocardia sp. CNY236]